VGGAAAYLPAHYRGDLFLVPVRHPACPGAALQPASDPLGKHHLYRSDSWRATGDDPVYGEHHGALFFPPGTRPTPCCALMVGITIFTAAYLAKNVRGGLQAIPRGQFEASHALGLNGFQTMTFIILPQALRSGHPSADGTVHRPIQGYLAGCHHRAAGAAGHLP